jgi:hypothetical protein
MKKLFALTVLIMAFASSAWSLSITVNSKTYDVGGVDTFLKAANLANSGDATELNWVKSWLGNDIVMEEKTDMGGSSQWVQTNEDPRVYAFDFVSYNPEYFLVKTGKTSSGMDTFLFANTPNLAYGVIDLDISRMYSIKNVGKLSHIDEFNAGAPVPEPASLMLIGTGLLGIAGFRKKVKA